MEKDFVVFSLSHEEWVQFQQVERGRSGPLSRETSPSKDRRHKVQGVFKEE